MAYTPQDIEEIPKNLSNIFTDLELKIMEDLIMRIKINGELTGTAEHDFDRLINMGESVSVIKKYVSTTLDLSFSEIENIFNDVLETGYSKDKDLFLAAGADFIPYKENKELQQLVEAVKQQTKDTCKNITNTMGFVKQVEGKQTFKPLTQYYKESLSRATIEITTGSFSYEQSLKRVVNEMTNSGVRTIDYASGKSSRIEVAARRALQTSVTQITSHISEQNMEALGTDIVEVSWHSTARPSHQVWQGRLFRWNKNKDADKIVGAKLAENNTNTPVYYNHDNSYKVEIEGYSPEVNESISQAAKNVAKMGSENQYEYLQLVDLKSGEKQKLMTDNEYGSVGGPKLWKIINDNPDKQFAFIHNHNTDGIFSETDLRTMLTTDNIPVMMAVRNDGIIYIAEKTKEVPNTTYYDELYKNDIKELNKKVSSGIFMPYERSMKREEIIVNNLLRDYTKAGRLVEIDGRK